MKGRRGSLYYFRILVAVLFRGLRGARTIPKRRRESTRADYNIHQSMEFGYRASYINGNKTPTIPSRICGSGLAAFRFHRGYARDDHNGLLFDHLNFSNFGYGGDPNDVTRLRIEKNKWYDFRHVVPAGQELLGL